MKKNLFFVIALCCFSTANAQTFRFGPTVAGSLNISNETKTKLGFTVGAKAEMDFNKMGHGWFMDASVLFNNRNRQSDDYFNSETKMSQHWKYSTYSLFIPVNVGYKFRLSDNLNFLLTSSSCHPKFFVKEFSYFLMPYHQHGLGVNLLVQR